MTGQNVKCICFRFFNLSPVVSYMFHLGFHLMLKHWIAPLHRYVSKCWAKFNVMALRDLQIHGRAYKLYFGSR